MNRRGVVLVITIVRTGGFAGLRKQWEVAADDPEEAEKWRPVIEACPWDEEPDSIPEPDRFVYQINTKLPGKVCRATVPEQHLTGPWRELLDRVREEAKPAPRESGTRKAGSGV